ncbi:11893_t:CDS:2 [Dentiscutata heterogama]|uniref:11893_t:CDS:1 n=1 Tax=Dentiscutata heterogama TaxID=1316150 RepID=A0ACA9JYF2_9GLOM|nr:11893_t:CDS:2 [Dentiscutata heterogama]
MTKNWHKDLKPQYRFPNCPRFVNSIYESKFEYNLELKDNKIVFSIFDVIDNLKIKN